ncbi:MAG: MFS transporter, partial [Nitrososphaeria archaeon]|nr:MFS transporter [Nitrososphaeria archaeon]NIN51698.1 MFS transporter [Nitrososphaeria archaeon]NIQ32200.1 MFS transporter [Nitrososphaeria archaeon]
MERHRKRLHYAWIIALTGLTVGITAIGFARFSYAMILPSMKDGLGLSYTQTGLLATANFVGYSLFTLIGGFVLARFGVRRLITFSLFVVSASMILTGISQTFEEAFFFRFLTGMGSGGSNVPRFALTALWFNSQLRGLAMGMQLTGDGVGLTIGGLVIPEILKMHGVEGWRYSWYTLGASTLITVLLSYLLLRDRPEEKGLKPLGRENFNQRNERKPPAVMTDNNPFKDFTLYHLGLVYFTFGFTYIIYATFFTVYLEREIGLSVELAGWLWSFVGLMGIGSAFIWGTVSDKIGRGRSLAGVYLI